MAQGWPNEPARHALSRKGVKTAVLPARYSSVSKPIRRRVLTIFEKQMLDLLDLDDTRLQRFASRLGTALSHSDMPVESITFVFELRYGNDREVTIFVSGKETDQPYYVSKDISATMKSVLGSDEERWSGFQRDVEKLVIERASWRDAGRCREVIISDGKKSVRVSVAG